MHLQHHPAPPHPPPYPTLPWHVTIEPDQIPRCAHRDVDASLQPKAKTPCHSRTMSSVCTGLLVLQAALHHYTEQWCTQAAVFTAHNIVLNIHLKRGKVRSSPLHSTQWPSSMGERLIGQMIDTSDSVITWPAAESSFSSVQQKLPPPPPVQYSSLLPYSPLYHERMEDMGWEPLPETCQKETNSVNITLPANEKQTLKRVHRFIVTTFTRVERVLS